MAPGRTVAFTLLFLPAAAHATGAVVGKWDFVFETGIKFRVNINETPIKPLHHLTDYWGLRMGIKYSGFHTINRLSYVLEFGAGSF